MDNTPQTCPLGEQDCSNLLNVVNHICPNCDRELERLKRAGFDLEQLRQDNATNRVQALGLLREYFPTRAPNVQVG